MKSDENWIKTDVPIIYSSLCARTYKHIGIDLRGYKKTAVSGKFIVIKSSTILNKEV